MILKGSLLQNIDTHYKIMHNTRPCLEQVLKFLPEIKSIWASVFSLPWKGLFPFLLMLALTLFSFLKYCGATKLKEMKSHESDATKMPALENYDMLIKYILLWIWTVFEIFF